MSRSSYDFLVLGGGSGGIAAAVRAASHGARVALIEQGRLGGTCVNVGCVPKKIMWYGSDVAHTLRHAGDYGFDVEVRGFDWGALKARRDRYVARLNDAYAHRLEREGIALIRGRATAVAERAVEVQGQHIEADHLLIATGGRPRFPALPGADLGISSDGFFELDSLPRRVAVVGGGYVAVELAGVLAGLGAEVTLVVRRALPLRGFDSVLRETVVEYLQQDGVRLVSEAAPVSLEREGDARLRLALSTGDAVSALDRVLWAIGREPNSAGLEATGVALEADGHVRTDDFQNTTVAGVYAVGDITGRAELTPVAIAAGRRLADRLFGGQPDRRLDYDLIPTVMFSHPPLGTVGLSEEDARVRYGESVHVYQSRFDPMFYALGDDKRACAIKLVTIGEEQRVVGCHVIGLGADELLQGFAVAIRMGASKADLDDTVAIHPTTAEELVTLR